jgi:hypothetical protein
MISLFYSPQFTIPVSLTVRSLTFMLQEYLALYLNLRVLTNLGNCCFIITSYDLHVSTTDCRNSEINPFQSLYELPKDSACRFENYLVQSHRQNVLIS